MRRFDSRRQDENETIPDFEQALRTLHREAWPTATSEQRDAALKRRFEDGLLSTEMVQFLRLHARDLDFHAQWLRHVSLRMQEVRVSPRKGLTLLTTVRKALHSQSGNPSCKALKK